MIPFLGTRPPVPLNPLWGLLWWQFRCVEGRRSVRCASQRIETEIPVQLELQPSGVFP